MKMKVLACLCLLALFLAGCSEQALPGGIDIPPEAQKNGVIRLKSGWWGGNNLERLTTEEERQSSLEWFREEYDGYACREFLPQNPGNAQAALVTEEDDAANGIFYTQGADWVTALYATVNYQSKEQMAENLLFRKTYLSDELARFLDENNRLQTLAGEMWNETRITVYESDRIEVDGVKNVYENGWTGYVFRIQLSFRTNRQDGIPPCFLQNDYRTGYSINTSEEGDVSFRGYTLLWIELLEQDGKIEGWRELSHRQSDRAGSRELIADETGVYRETGVHPWPTLPHKVSYGEKEELWMPTSKKQAITERGLSLYKPLIGLDYTRTAEADFGAVLSLCSPALREQLEKADFFGTLVRDCAKQHVRIQTDPVAAGKIDNTKFVYSAPHEQYGTVYMIRRNAFMRSGSQTFNEQYALNDEGFSAEVSVYMAETDAGYEIVAFRIRADLDENSEAMAQDFWSGTGDRG